MAMQKKDFIEIEFTGRVKDGELFDSNIKEDLEKANLNLRSEPFIFCLGEGMFLKGIEDFLIGKEIGKYEIGLEPEEAFGKRSSQLIQIVPMKFFAEQKIRPVQGMVLNFDSRIGRVLTVSGGRVIVDFNNPLAGKQVVYKINVLRKVEDLNEKIKSFINFLFKKDFPFEVKESKLILKMEKSLSNFVKLFEDKFKEIFNLNLEVLENDKEEISKDNS
ncbi:MAG: peptidylprolyl isomerase [archaeon]